MKKNRKKDEFLDQLRKIPIIQVVCEKIDLSRNTVYRWRKENEEFAKAMDEALLEGETLVNEMSESQLISMIRDKNWPAISFWLRHRNPKFRNRVEISGTIKTPNEQLNPEQSSTVKKALRFAALIEGVNLIEENTNLNNSNNSNEPKSIPATGNSGQDAEGQKSENSDSSSESSNVL